MHDIYDCSLIQILYLTKEALLSVMNLGKSFPGWSNTTPLGNTSTFLFTTNPSTPYPVMIDLDGNSTSALFR